MKICFLDSTPFKYTYLNKYHPELRGAETILINLYENLKALGHDVHVFNNCDENFETKKNKWFNLKSINSSNYFDIAVANSDMNLLNLVNSPKKFVISHSLQSIEKFIRKGQLKPYLKHRPTIFHVGKYHMKKRSKLLSLFGSKILDISIDNIFLNTSLSNNIDNNLAIFTSRPDRNLDILIDIWVNKICPNFKNGKLLVTPNNFNIQSKNIIFRKMISQKNLITDLLKSKLFLIPGHKSELYCLAAEEARELCIPTVTLGIGSLSERVSHGKTGYIAKNKDEFAEYSLLLFKNSHEWLKIRQNLLNLRGTKNWINSSKKFLELIK